MSRLIPRGLGFRGWSRIPSPCSDQASRPSRAGGVVHAKPRGEAVGVKVLWCISAPSFRRGLRAWCGGVVAFGNRICCLCAHPARHCGGLMSARKMCIYYYKFGNGILTYYRGRGSLLLSRAPGRPRGGLMSARKMCIYYYKIGNGILTYYRGKGSVLVVRAPRKALWGGLCLLGK